MGGSLDPDEFPDGTFTSEAARENYAMVMSRLAQRRQKGANPKQNGARRAQPALPPRDARDVKCANCNQAGHTAQQCSRPKLAMSERKCHICDKPSHFARNCFCVTDDEGLATRVRTRSGAPAF